MSIPDQQIRAVVTGGAGGLGRAFCLVLARRGGRVLVADRDLAGAEATMRQVVALGGQAEAIACDVAKPEEVEALASAAHARFGGVDLLINNAGVGVSGPTGEIPLGDWEWIVGVNLWGVIHGCHAFVPLFKQQRAGHILNVASAAGLLCAPLMGPYNVTKAGVIALSETLCTELKPFGVGVTALCPTYFKTGIADSGRATGSSAELAAFVRKQMEKSPLQAEDVARIALADCARGRLYSVPMPDGRLAWRLKRAAPELFYSRILPRIRDYMSR